MKTVLVFSYPLNSQREFELNARRWVETLLKHNPGASYQVMVCLVDGTPTDADRAIFRDVQPKFVTFPNPGLDIDAYLKASAICDADFAVFCNTRIHFWKEGWLARFIEARKQHGPKGLYGASASYQIPSRPWTTPPVWPNPHIRTACIATDPKILRRYPFSINSRNDAFRAESGQWNLGQWYEDHGWPVRMITWDGVWSKQDWRKPKNIFRRGDQSNCLVRDRHLDIYSACTDPKEKRNLEVLAGLETVMLK
jgi:hypothetical protein